MEKTKLVLTVMYEFKYREKPKKMFSLNFSHYQCSGGKEINNNFLVGNSSAGAVFLIEILMEEPELVVVENAMFQ